MFGFDASVGVRTMLAQSEIGLGGRMTFVDNEPFSAAAFTNFWWGSKLFDDSKRTGFTWDVGGIASLTALTHVTITGRAYLEVWSDRHCPSLAAPGTTNNGFDGTDPIKVCTQLKDNTISMDDRARLKSLIGTDVADNDHAFGRDSGARFMLSIAGELAFDQQWNAYFILEGAPFQTSERALFTNLFSASMPDTDLRIYARTGLTYKF